ncbi:TPA: phage protein NinX family protein [Klebsiella pneumoniae]
MDYSKLSDFEINAAVFEALHGGAPDYKEGDAGKMILISYEGDVVGGDAVEVEVERGVFNPCNNPADAWPIIHQNLIALKPVVMYVGGHRWFATKGDADFEIKSANDNPLRAAMELFLMMQESEQSPS